MHHQQIIYLSLWSLLASGLCADDGPKYPVRRVRLVDQLGEPVSKAFTLAWLVNERYFWPVDQLGGTASVSNDDGLADIKYPTQANFIEPLPVESIKPPRTICGYQEILSGFYTGLGEV